MALYAVSDLHLSFSTDKPMDVFGSKWQNYTARLQNNWQKLVTNNDTVVINGDISWAMDLEQARRDFEYIHSLNGRKLISKGNHDYWWSTAAKIEDFLFANGFDSIKLLHNNAYECGELIVAGTRGWLVEGGTPHDDKITLRESARLELSIKSAEKLNVDGDKEVVVFLHYPPAYAGSVNEPLLEVLYRHNIKRVYYGHLHGVSPAALTTQINGISLRLVACDHLAFVPLRI